jgi:hypothetical protein
VAGNAGYLINEPSCQPRVVLPALQLSIRVGYMMNIVTAGRTDSVQGWRYVVCGAIARQFTDSAVRHA